MGSLTSFLSKLAPTSIFGVFDPESLAGLDSVADLALGYYFLGSYFLDSSFFTYFLGYYFLVYCFGASPAGLALSGSMSNNGFPTSRLSPAVTWNLRSLPAWGLLISTVTLSVSTLATVSSWSTHSPSSENYNKSYF